MHYRFDVTPIRASRFKFNKIYLNLTIFRRALRVAAENVAGSVHVQIGELPEGRGSGPSCDSFGSRGYVLEKNFASQNCRLFSYYARTTEKGSTITAQDERSSFSLDSYTPYNHQRLTDNTG